MVSSIVFRDKRITATQVRQYVTPAYIKSVADSTYIQGIVNATYVQSLINAAYVQSLLTPNMMNDISNVEQLVTPTTGANVGVNNATTYLIINPAGTLLTLTVTFPVNPYHGQELSITTTQAIVAVNLTGGTILNSITSLILGGFCRYKWHSTMNRWMRIC